MEPNPFLGVVLHWLGGLGAGSFYVPYKGVKHWAWETYWIVGGFFSWIVCPWVLALLMTNDLIGVLQHQSAATLWWTFLFGVAWGVGGVTFGLTMRYLGMSLGMGIALGYCAAFGTLLPPMFKTFMASIPVPENIVQIASTLPGKVTLGGVLVCLVGIAMSSLAGLAKEKEMPEEEKKKAIAEFNFGKGIVVATICGIMSACFAFALTAGNPIGEASMAAGTKEIWTGLPKLVVVLLGGFSTNLVWCVYLNIRNGTGGQYVNAKAAAGPALGEETIIETATDAPGEEMARDIPTKARADVAEAPLLANYCFCALAGVTWYLQFFFYTMGETQMGKYKFVSWALHMASIIIFSTIWGWILREWKGASRKAHLLIAAGVAVLILSTVIIGYGTRLHEIAAGH